MTMPADHPPFVIIDTARLLVVDPCRIEPQLVRELVADRLAVLVETNSDGPYVVTVDDDGTAFWVEGPGDAMTITDPAEAQHIAGVDSGEDG